MTYKVLVDVCIFQDVITKRKGWEGSQKVLKLFDREDNEGWISSLTKPIIYFLSVKKIGEKNARLLVTDLTRSFSEIPLRHVINQKALINILPEYEDNIQLESARQFHMDAIITRNKKHYKQENMPVYAPEEFLDLLDQNSEPTTLAVPFLDLKAQHYQIYNEVDDRITDIIANTAFIQGKHVEEFDVRFAEAQGARYCIGVSSGTDALHVAMMALGIAAGDRVIVPVNTFIATAEAVSLCGAEPVFVDCDGFYNMDVEKLRCLLQDAGMLECGDAGIGKENLGIKEIDDRGQRSEIRGCKAGIEIEKLITNNDSRITAIIPVHLYGQPANMDKIMAMAEEYDLKVVEDCCQAHLAMWRMGPQRNNDRKDIPRGEHGAWRKVGNFGEFGCFSFYPGKNLGAYGEAGALITNNDELYQRAKMIRQHGELMRYHHQMIGHNYRMEAIQGAVLATKIKYLNEWTEKRRANASLYSELLKNVEGVETPVEPENVYAVYHLYVIQVDDRDGLQRYLQENGISTGLHYPVPLHLQKAYQIAGHEKGDFPVAERAAKRILSLPMYPELTEWQIRYVCDKIKEYY